MEKGTLIEFRVNNQRRLAVIDRPEGKKHWIAIDQHLQAHTIHPRQLTFTVPEERFRPQEIPAFWQQVQPLLDTDSLEVAWEILREETAPLLQQIWRSCFLRSDRRWPATLLTIF